MRFHIIKKTHIPHLLDLILNHYMSHKTDFGIILLLLQHLASQYIHLLLQ